MKKKRDANMKYLVIPVIEKEKKKMGIQVTIKDIKNKEESIMQKKKGKCKVKKIKKRMK